MQPLFQNINIHLSGRLWDSWRWSWHFSIHPHYLLGIKGLQSLTSDINTYLKTKQLFSFLLPPHCAALGGQHSHCYIPTLQFSVSSWPAVLSSSDWFSVFISSLGKKQQLTLYFRIGKKGSCLPFPWEQAHDGHGAVVFRRVITWLMYSRPPGDKLTLLSEPLRHCSTLACPCRQVSTGF